jgi:hypothetical protein
MIDVAIRWSHVEIVGYLLEEIEWEKQEIKNAVSVNNKHPNKAIK